MYAQSLRRNHPLTLTGLLFAVLLVLAGVAMSNRAVEAQVGAEVDLAICGEVDSYTAATGLVPGALVIDGQSFVLAAGTELTNSNLLTANADICLSASLNASGDITGGSITANAATAVEVCGAVTAFTAATAAVPGSITIGGQTFPIAAGTTLDGQGLATVGADLCLDATANGAGQLEDGTLTANATAAVEVCGAATAFTAATATAPGSITIGGQTFPIAAGTTLDGQALATVGADLCLDATANGAGQLEDGTLTADAAATVDVCGTVTAFTAATATAPGSITVGGQTFSIAAGTDLGSDVVVGADLCLSGDLGDDGEIGEGEVEVGPNPGPTATATPTATSAVTSTPATSGGGTGAVPSPASTGMGAQDSRSGGSTLALASALLAVALVAGGAYVVRRRI